MFGGAVAQLGARLDGIEEVVGSNPIGSTKKHRAYFSPAFTLKVNPQADTVLAKPWRMPQQESYWRRLLFALCPSGKSF